MPEPLRLYGHAACPKVPPLRLALWVSKIPYEYINIHQDTAAAARVREINHGFESVPTLVFPDGTSLTEPDFNNLKQTMALKGYRMNPLSWLAANLGLVVIGMFILMVFLKIMGVF